MGLLGTLQEFGDLMLAIPSDYDSYSFVSEIFANGMYSDNRSVSQHSYNLYLALEKRSAFYAHDIFYAILPVFDKSVVGKSHVEAWDSIRVELATTLFNKNKMRSTTWIDPYWFGITNPQILHSFATPIKLKGWHTKDKLYVNWTIADMKFHVIVDLVRLKEETKLEENTWYFYDGIPKYHNASLVYEGHKEETNEWKEYTFVWSMKEELVIRLISASDLYAADFGGTSDPYVQLSTDSFKKIWRISDVIKKTVNPVWNEIFTTPVPGKDDVLSLNVYDKNLLKKDVLIGTASIKLDILKDLQEEIVTVPLTGPKAKGTVTLGLTKKVQKVIN